jgi:hypothetical protein
VVHRHPLLWEEVGPTLAAQGASGSWQAGDLRVKIRAFADRLHSRGAFSGDFAGRAPIWPQDAAAEAKRPVYGGVFMRVKQMYLGANRPPRLT